MTPKKKVSVKGPFVPGFKDTTPGKVGGFRRVWISMNRDSIAARAVEKARKQVGYKESPPGSNGNKFGKFWGEDGVSWCGLFVAWAWQDAGFKISRELALKIDYVPELVSLASKKLHGLRIVSKDEVKKGDAVAFDWPAGHKSANGDGTADHVELFDKWINKSQGIFRTVGGNTGSVDRSNGGEVLENVRYTKNVQAFVRKLATAA